jgi:hypothetical protein
VSERERERGRQGKRLGEREREGSSSSREREHSCLDTNTQSFLNKGVLVVTFKQDNENLFYSPVTARPLFQQQLYGQDAL